MDRRGGRGESDVEEVEEEFKEKVEAEVEEEVEENEEEDDAVDGRSSRSEEEHDLGLEEDCCSSAEEAKAEQGCRIGSEAA